MNDKEFWIDKIDALYPIDAPYKETRGIGKNLLTEAISEHDWRDLPVEILETYATKCIAEHNRRVREFLKK